MGGLGEARAGFAGQTEIDPFQVVDVSLFLLEIGFQHGDVVTAVGDRVSEKNDPSGRVQDGAKILRELGVRHWSQRGFPGAEACGHPGQDQGKSGEKESVAGRSARE